MLVKINLNEFCFLGNKQNTHTHTHTRTHARTHTPTHTHSHVGFSCFIGTFHRLIYKLYKQYFLFHYPNHHRKLSSIYNFPKRSICIVYKLVSSWEPKTKKISPQGQYLLVLLFLYIVWGSGIQNKQLHTVTVTYYMFHVCVCVVLVFPTLWGPNVPTRIVIPVHFELLGTFGPITWEIPGHTRAGWYFQCDDHLVSI